VRDQESSGWGVPQRRGQSSLGGVSDHGRVRHVFLQCGFRKLFTAAGFEEDRVLRADLKSVLVTAQVIAHTIFRFVGIMVVSERAPVPRV